jgi:hypothetical protein
MSPLRAIVGMFQTVFSSYGDGALPLAAFRGYSLREGGDGGRALSSIMPTAGSS